MSNDGVCESLRCGATLGEHFLCTASRERVPFCVASPLLCVRRAEALDYCSGDDCCWLVLGVSGAGIQTLHTLPPQAEAPAPAAHPALAGFAQLLQRQRAAKARPAPGVPDAL